MSIYRITCLPNGKVYIGQSSDPQKRFKAHKHTPPTRMSADVAAYKPFSEHFQLDILHASIASKHMANVVEEGCIKEFDACNPAKGYNTLRGMPFSDKRFWWAQKHRASK